MKDTLRDFIGALLALIEFIGFILIIGFAGGVDQDMISIGDGYKRFLVVGGIMVAAGLALYFLSRDDKRQ